MKLLGALGILIAAAVLAARGSTVFWERIRQMEGFLLLLRHIREQIGVLNTPKEQLFTGFSHPALTRAGITEAALGGGLSSALAGAEERLYLDSEEIAILEGFAAALGSSYAAEEVARCDLAIARLTAAIGTRRESRPQAARLFRTLLVSGAAAIVLVLI